MRHDHILELIRKLVQENSIPGSRELEIIEENALGKKIKKSLFLCPVDDAKFVVTQSSTKEGRDYCRWLINCEKVVDKLKDLSPQLQFLIQLEIKQKEQDARLAAVEEEMKKVTRSIGAAGFYSVMAYAAAKKVRITLSEAGTLGRMASKKCKELGVQVCSIPDPRFGTVNTYPEEILEEVWAK
jgi:hypothetical protein